MSFNDFAIQVVGIVEDRTYQYIYNRDSLDRKLGTLIRQLSYVGNYTNEMPILA